jgi:hypothetical protein
MRERYALEAAAPYFGARAMLRPDLSKYPGGVNPLAQP